MPPPYLVPGIDLSPLVKQLFEDVQVSSTAGPEHRGPVQLQNKEATKYADLQAGEAGHLPQGGAFPALTKSRASTAAPAASSLLTSCL